MRTRDWLVILGVVAAPLFACSSSDSAGTGGAGGSAGGTVKNDGGAGSAGKAGSGGGTAGGGGSTGTCDLAWNGDKGVCDTCFQTKCATECGQCGAGSDCDAMYTCFFACAETDTACQKACTTDHADGYAVAMSMGDCVDANCADPCASTADACQTCQTDKCGTEIDKCMANTDCVAINTCYSKCSDQACADACLAASPNGKADFTAAMTCVQTNCAADCK